MLEGAFDGIANLIFGLMIAVVVCSCTFGLGGYLIGNSHGKTIGYKKGAKDALSGKVRWQQTIVTDSILIIK